MAESTETLRSVIRDGIRSGELSLTLRDRVKLRLVLRFKPEELESAILEQAQAEGLVPVSMSLDDQIGAVDWKSLTEFIVKILPAIIQMILLFL